MIAFLSRHLFRTERDGVGVEVNGIHILRLVVVVKESGVKSDDERYWRGEVVTHRDGAEWYVWALPVEGKDDLSDCFADGGDHMGPQTVHQGFLFCEGEQ